MTAGTITDEHAAGIKPSASKVGAAVDKLLAAAPEQSVLPIALDRLFPNPDNPRESAGDIIEMADSIRSVGILEPLIVATAAAFQDHDGRLPNLELGDYVLIAGHRRLAAADLAAIKTAPCIVRDDLVGVDADVAMLVENVHREGLSAIEEARSFQRLREQHGLTQAEIAKMVGKNQSHVSKRLSLLDLSPEIQAEVAKPDGMPLVDALAIAKYADNKAVTNAIIKRPDWQSVEEAAEQALRKEQRATALTEAKKRLKDQGVRKIVAYDEWMLTTPVGVPRALSYLAADGLDVDEHIHHECHAVAVGYTQYGTELHSVPVCTDPKNHPESADTKRDEQAAKAAAKRDREAKMGEKRHADRVEAIRVAVSSASKISADTSATANLCLFVDTVVESFEEDEYRTLVAVLGLAVDVGDDAAGMYARMDGMRDALLNHVATGPNELKRTLVASALVRAEARAEQRIFSSGGSSTQRALLQWLPTHGYSLSSVEKARLKDLADG